MAVIEQTYHYTAASALHRANGGADLTLVCERDLSGPAHFLTARALFPDVVGKGLRAVSEIVGTRYYTPPSTLARILREADPVATVSPGAVRFEGISACCSVYARMDLRDEALDVSHRRNGTTNVDFGPELRAALANVPRDADLDIRIGADAVEVTRDATTVIERKVPLPLRWVKGFAQVQLVLSDMTPAFRLGRIAAQRFLRALPRSSADHLQWVSAGGGQARCASRESAGAVPLRGAHRLRVLEALVPRADHLDVYHDPATGTSAWVLTSGAHVLTLVLNAEPWRGFSGDGASLSEMARSDGTVTAQIRAWLNWQDRIDPGSLAASTGLARDQVERGLAELAAGGLVGYDLHDQSYFHRVLPFDLDQITALNPRLDAARALVAEGAVTLGTPSSHVRSGDVVHRVSRGPEGARCTCPWFSKNGAQRGPCKHILAVQIVEESIA